MIKLVLLIPTLDRSGAEKQLTLLATRLPRPEFDLHVLALTRGGPYERDLREHEIPVTILGKRWRFDPPAWWSLRRELARLSPHVLHTWLFAANSYGRLAAGPRRPWKTVVSERCVDTWKAPWQLWLDRRLIARTDRLIANSHAVADFYRQQGVPDDLITVIPNAIECPAREGAPHCGRHADSGPSSTVVPRSTSEETRERRDDRAQLRVRLLKELEIPPDARLIGCVGRLARQKRIDDLLWAAQVLRQADERAYLLIIGDGPERARLEQHARNVECAAHVRFLGHRSDVAQLLRLLDIYWLGSDFEGMSNSLMEAMAAGIPVVATDIPPNRELVKHGEHGYLVGVGDGVGFAQFTLRLLHDEPLARRLGAAGRQRMAEEFSVKKMVAAHAALYRQLSANPHAKSVAN